MGQNGGPIHSVVASCVRSQNKNSTVVTRTLISPGGTVRDEPVSSETAVSQFHSANSQSRPGV